MQWSRTSTVPNCRNSLTPSATRSPRSAAQRSESEIDAPALAQVAYRVVIGRDDPGKPAELGHHVGERRAFVDRHRAHRRAAELERLADATAGTHRGEGQQVQST